MFDALRCGQRQGQPLDPKALEPIHQCVDALTYSTHVRVSKLATDDRIPGLCCVIDSFLSCMIKASAKVCGEESEHKDWYFDFFNAIGLDTINLLCGTKYINMAACEATAPALAMEGKRFDRAYQAISSGELDLSTMNSTEKADSLFIEIIKIFNTLT